MRKTLLFTFAMLMVVSMLFSAAVTPAAAKQPKGPKGIVLISAEYISGKGVVFKFEANGDFDPLVGFVTLLGHKYVLDCHFNDDGEIVCTAEQGLSRFISELAVVTLNGYTSSAHIRHHETNQYCYPVFDEVFLETSPMPTFSAETPWEQAGVYCQDAPANVGDEIYWFNPAYDSSYFYDYSLNGADINTNPPDMGPGYYWNAIPE